MFRQARVSAAARRSVDRELVGITGDRRQLPWHRCVTLSGDDVMCKTSNEFERGGPQWRALI
jgi:hypothetical protein